MPAAHPFKRQVGRTRIRCTDGVVERRSSSGTCRRRCHELFDLQIIAVLEADTGRVRRMEITFPVKSDLGAIEMRTGTLVVGSRKGQSRFTAEWRNRNVRVDVPLELRPLKAKEGTEEAPDISFD